MTPQTLTPAELDELAALEAKATPGEWTARRSGLGGALVETVEGTVASVKHTGADADNAALIAALRNHAPALLAMARRLASLNETVRLSTEGSGVDVPAIQIIHNINAQLTTATARADAADARAQAAEKRCVELIDIVEDRLNYIDDRHVVKELRAALAAAKLGGG